MVMSACLNSERAPQAAALDVQVQEERDELRDMLREGLRELREAEEEGETSQEDLAVFREHIASLQAALGGAVQARPRLESTTKFQKFNLKKINLLST